MARFQLKSGATLRQLGEKIHQLATMSNTEYSAAVVDPRAFFSGVLDVPSSTDVVLVKDEQNLRHIIVPYYPEPPTSGGAEMAGVVVLCGCSE